MLVKRKIEPQIVEDLQEFSCKFCPNFSMDSLYAMLGLGLLDLLCRRKGCNEERIFRKKIHELCVKLKKLGKYSKKTKIFDKLSHVLEVVTDSEQAIDYLYYYIKLNANEEIESIIETVKFLILFETCEKSVKEMIERKYVLNDFYVCKIIQEFSDYFKVCVFYYKGLEILKILPIKGESWPIIFLSEGSLGCYSLLFPEEFTDSIRHSLIDYPFLYSNKEYSETEAVSGGLELNLGESTESIKINVDLYQSGMTSNKKIENPNIIIKKKSSFTEEVNRVKPDLNFSFANSIQESDSESNSEKIRRRNLNKKEKKHHKVKDLDEKSEQNIEVNQKIERQIPDESLGLTLYKLNKLNAA